jgi:hypothetical protein
MNTSATWSHFTALLFGHNGHKNRVARIKPALSDMGKQSALSFLDKVGQCRTVLSQSRPARQLEKTPRKPDLLAFFCKPVTFK